MWNTLKDNLKDAEYVDIENMTIGLLTVKYNMIYGQDYTVGDIDFAMDAFDCNLPNHRCPTAASWIEWLCTP